MGILDRVQKTTRTVFGGDELELSWGWATLKPIDDATLQPISQPQQNEKSFIDVAGKFFTDVIANPITKVYNNYYDENPDTIKNILWRDVSDAEVNISAPTGKAGVFGGIARAVYNFIKPNDFKKQMDRTEELFNSSYGTFEEWKQQISMLTNEYSNWRIGDQDYQNGVLAVGNAMYSNYNQNAERLWLGKMKTFDEYEEAMYTLKDMDYNKKIVNTAREEAKSDLVNKIFKDKTSDTVKTQIGTELAQQQAALQDIVSKRLYTLTDPAKWRMFDGQELSNSDLVKWAEDLTKSFVAQYNSLLEYKKTALDLMEKNPGFNPERELWRIDNAIEKVKGNQQLFLQEYIDYVGKEWATNISDFTRMYEKKTGTNLADLWSADVGLWFRITDERELANIKNLMLLKRDIYNLTDINSSWWAVDALSQLTTALVSPLRFEWGKARLWASTALSAFSLARGTVVTPMFKNAASFVNTIVNKAILWNTTDFYNGGMNMLKSAAFNFDESKDYTLTDFFRKSAELAPDIAEFIIPISKVAEAQQALWKWTTALTKGIRLAKSSANLARWIAEWATISKMGSKVVSAGTKSLSYVTDIQNAKAWAFETLQKWLTYYLLDYNVINAPFETRNPREYSTLDAVFDLSFTSAEIVGALRKMQWPIWTQDAWKTIKDSNRFAEDVYKAVAFRWQAQDIAESQWLKIASNAEEHAAAIWFAKNFIRYWETYPAIAWLAGIDAAKFWAGQDALKKARANLTTQLNQAYADWTIRQWRLSEQQANDMATAALKETDIPELVEDRSQYLLAESKKKPVRTYSPKIDDADDTLVKITDELDSSDKALQESGITKLKDNVDTIRKELESWTLSPSEAAKKNKQMNLYLDFVEFYGKTKKWLKENVRVDAKVTDEDIPSNVLWRWWYAYRDWEIDADVFRKLKNDKPRQPMDGDRDTWRENGMFKWYDGEYHNVDMKRFFYDKTKAKPGSTLQWEFYIMRTRDSKWDPIYHVQDFIISNPDEVSKRFGATIEELESKNLPNFWQTKPTKTWWIPAEEKVFEDEADNLFKDKKVVAEVSTQTPAPEPTWFTRVQDILKQKFGKNIPATPAPVAEVVEVQFKGKDPTNVENLIAPWERLSVDPIVWKVQSNWKKTVIRTWWTFLWGKEMKHTVYLKDLADGKYVFKWDTWLVTIEKVGNTYKKNWTPVKFNDLKNTVYHRVIKLENMMSASKYDTLKDWDVLKIWWDPKIADEYFVVKWGIVEWDQTRTLKELYTSKDIAIAERPAEFVTFVNVKDPNKKISWIIAFPTYKDIDNRYKWEVVRTTFMVWPEFEKDMKELFKPNKEPYGWNGVRVELVDTQYAENARRKYIDSDIAEETTSKIAIINKTDWLSNTQIAPYVKEKVLPLWYTNNYRYITELWSLPVSDDDIVKKIFATTVSTERIFKDMNTPVTSSDVINLVEETNKKLTDANKIDVTESEVEYIVEKINYDIIGLNRPIERMENTAQQYLKINPNDVDAQQILESIKKIDKKEKAIFSSEVSDIIAWPNLDRALYINNKQAANLNVPNAETYIKQNDNAVKQTKADVIMSEPLVNQSAVVAERNTSSWVKRLFPQIQDNLPTKFVESFQEYKRINWSMYKIWSEQMHEVIPAESTKEFNSMVSNMQIYLDSKKKWYVWPMLDTATEAQMKTLWRNVSAYYDDMSILAWETFPWYVNKPLTDVKKTLNLMRDANKNESLFYFLSRTDKSMYDSIVKSNNIWATIEALNIPNPAGLSDRVLYDRFKNNFIDLARQWTGNSAIRFMGRFMDPNNARRLWNFTTWWAYIIGTTIVNVAQLPSMLFINAIWLTTDAVFKWTGRLRKDLRAWEKFWSSKELTDIMDSYWFLWTAEEARNIPNFTAKDPLATMKYFANPKNWKALNRITNNMVNAGLYNAAEITFDWAFKRERVLETLVADRWLTSKTDFDAFVWSMDNAQRADFFRNVNEASTRRYVYKTGNDFAGLKKFTYWHDVNIYGKLAKNFMWSIWLLTNWWTTHIRSFNDLITGYRTNKIALNSYEMWRTSISDSKAIVQDLLNYNYDYEMLINKIFFTLSIGRKLDRIADNDTEDDMNVFSKLADITDFAKYLYAPLSWPSSNAIYRIITQTVGSALLANKHEEHDLNAIEAAWTTFLWRIFSEMKRRFVIPASVTQWLAVTAAEWDNWYDAFGNMFAAYKKSTSGFGYFLDRDMNYYGYEVDMPYTPWSELKLFMPEYDKNRKKFMELSTLKQLEEIQKTDKTLRDYLSWRVPIWKDINIWAMWETTDLDKLNHYMTNDPKYWNELQKWILNLNDDIDAGEYVFNTLTEHATQDFTDKGAADNTKQWLYNFAKAYFFKWDNWEMIPVQYLNTKEWQWVKNMFKLVDEDKMWVFFSEYVQTDNSKQKQWLQLLAFVQAALDAQGKWEMVPWAQRELTAAIAKDMYYQMSNQEKKRLWYSWGDGYLSDLNPQVDREVKYIVADMLGDSLFYTDKDARVGIARYFNRDKALKEWNTDIINLYGSKYNEEWKLKYGRVNLAYELENDDWGKSNNYLYNSLNNLYVRWQMQAAEGKLSWDRFNVAFSALLAPKWQKRTTNPAYYNMTLQMARTLATVIDESNACEQDKVSAKAGLWFALINIIDKAGPDIVEAITPKIRWENQQWLRWTFKTIGEMELALWYKTIQDGKINKEWNDTWTILDYYDNNGNYKNTYWNTDPVWTYANNKKYTSSIQKYYRKYYNEIPKTYIKSDRNQFGKEAYYKNLYLKFADAESEWIPGGAGRWQWVTTGFTLKWGKPINIKPRQKSVPLAKPEWLIRRTTRSAAYPRIVSTVRTART